MCSQEEEPLGTAGPIRLAKELIMCPTHEGKSEDCPFFFVFNSDVICEYPLQTMLEFHKSHGKEATMITKQVEDPSKYGVVVMSPTSTEDGGRVTRFVEKPKEFLTNYVNAGLYIFNKSIVDRIELKPHFLEKDVFPRLAEEGQLYACPLRGFWMDLGQPKDFLLGTKYYLQHLKDQGSLELAKGDNIIGNVLIHPTAKVDSSSVIGPNVVIGENCTIARGVRLSDTCIMSKTLIKAHAFVRNSIIGW